jgi:PDZ domain-containing protein
MSQPPADPAPPSRPRAGQGGASGAPWASRRSATVLVAALGVVAALAVASAVRVPYVALTPGPTLNTLGAAGKQPLIQISGHQTYPVSGHLNLVTVSFRGGPGTKFNVFSALRAWLSPHEAVVPQEEIFTPGQSEQQVTKQDTEEMANSQQTAQVAALCQLRIPFSVIDTVVSTVKGKPAAGVLRRGDVIQSVDGTKVTCTSTSSTLIRSHRPGSTLTLGIRRGGATRQVRLATVRANGQPEIGVSLSESFRFPFSVKININDIGGPSAGLMFALGIIDKLTPGDLTGGRFIAGTGEIESDGTVDPIGGIQQKMVGARQAGATVFLTPAENCSDAVGAVPAGMRLVKVSTLRGALAALSDLKTGRPTPSC